MKFIFIILFSIVVAGEMEVDGDLIVTGGIDSPTIDALSGMKPERIYTFQRGYDEGFSFTVPENKMWVVQGVGTQNVYIKIDNKSIMITSMNGYTSSLVIFSGKTITPIYTDEYYLNIYEYSISGSGTEQGLDYIEP